MKASIIYQEIKAEGKLKGEINLILRQLSLRVGLISPGLLARIQQLTLLHLDK